MKRQLRRPAALLATIAGTATILLWMKLGNAKTAAASLRTSATAPGGTRLNGRVLFA
ncbi:hypothetical protein [Paenibacillus cineris]|uniref:Uncharacterized protein n=1 Tax=Paenibacillus cineris TaxID=237530 RepID=A0ABQ4LLX4_9BACL|nr:hypothetical protein [Paenibacillus cineris]GIO57285.1 hypothetical protein J21TS7_56030 [Paenibacillus cineris]